MENFSLLEYTLIGQLVVHLSNYLSKLIDICLAHVLSTCTKTKYHTQMSKIMFLLTHLYPQLNNLRTTSITMYNSKACNCLKFCYEMSSTSLEKIFVVLDKSSAKIQTYNVTSYIRENVHFKILGAEYSKTEN